MNRNVVPRFALEYQRIYRRGPAKSTEFGVIWCLVSIFNPMLITYANYRLHYKALYKPEV